MRNTTQASQALTRELSTDTRMIIRSAADVKRQLLMKYGSLSKAAKTLDVPYNQLSDVLNGRLHTSYILAAFKDDLKISDAEIEALFPRPMSAREYKLAQATA